LAVGLLAWTSAIQFTDDDDDDDNNNNNNNNNSNNNNNNNNNNSAKFNNYNINVGLLLLLSVIRCRYGLADSAVGHRTPTREAWLCLMGISSFTSLTMEITGLIKHSVMLIMAIKQQN